MTPPPHTPASGCKRLADCITSQIPFGWGEQTGGVWLSPKPTASALAAGLSGFWTLKGKYDTALGSRKCAPAASPCMRCPSEPLRKGAVCWTTVLAVLCYSSTLPCLGQASFSPARNRPDPSLVAKWAEEGQHGPAIGAELLPAAAFSSDSRIRQNKRDSILSCLLEKSQSRWWTGNAH